MKLHRSLLVLPLVASLDAGQTTLERYTEFRNQSNTEKIEANRELMLKMRENSKEIRDHREAIRDYRMAATYARIASSQTPYR